MVIELNCRTSRPDGRNTKPVEQLDFSPAFLIFHLHSLIISSHSKGNACSLGDSSH